MKSTRAGSAIIKSVDAAHKGLVSLRTATERLSKELAENLSTGDVQRLLGPLRGAERKAERAGESEPGAVEPPVQPGSTPASAPIPEPVG